MSNRYAPVYAAIFAAAASVAPARAVSAQSAGAPSPFAAVGPTFVGLSVASVDSAVAWYTSKLGFRLAMRVPHNSQSRSQMALVQAEGITIEFVQHDDAVPLASVLAGNRGSLYVHGPFKFGFTVADFDGAVTALRERQVPIAIGPFPKRADQPANLMIRDHAGNYIQIFGR
jgi:catechol 2,3-dioxygenase-like lactoylglutathione lyase family enzyme